MMHININLPKNNILILWENHCTASDYSIICIMKLLVNSIKISALSQNIFGTALFGSIFHTANKSIKTNAYDWLIGNNFVKI
jgi:hypothetical protein